MNRGEALPDGLNIDLHTHSSCSDGALAPTELVERAAAAGIHALALTDHDCTTGLAEARRAAERNGIVFVPGVEISAAWRAQSLHVLGLWIDPGERNLAQGLDAQAERRRSRLRAMCAKLTRLNLPGADLQAVVEAQRGVPTRAHLAEALRAFGHVTRTDEAFRKYLGKGGAAYASADWPPLAEIVGWIRGAGGIASLAHPARYALSAGAKRQLLADFTACGGEALEVVGGGNAAQHVEASTRLAVKYGLMGSVGSDFHSPHQIWNPLGRSLKLPHCVIPVWRAYGLESQ